MMPAGDRTDVYLVADVSSEPGRTLAAAEAAFDAASCSALLLMPPPGPESTAIAILKPLVSAAQERGIAALVAENAALAISLQADGVHLASGPDVFTRYENARRELGATAIVGAGAGASRDAAMRLGEAGADYVAFEAGGNPGEANFACDPLDLIGWWAEVFEIPCVAFDAAGPAEATALRDAGADFVGIRLTVEETAPSARTRLLAIVAALHQAESVPPANKRSG